MNQNYREEYKCILCGELRWLYNFDRWERRRCWGKYSDKGIYEDNIMICKKCKGHEILL